MHLLLFHVLLVIHCVRLLFELDLCPLVLLFYVLVDRLDYGRYLAGDRPGMYLNNPPYRFIMSFVVKSADEANNDGSDRISTKSEGT